MPDKAESLEIIRSVFEGDPPTTHDVVAGSDIPHVYARGMITLHLYSYEYDGDKEWDALVAEVWESIFPTPPKTFEEIAKEQGWPGVMVAAIAQSWAKSDRMVTLDEWARQAAERENGHA